MSRHAIVPLEATPDTVEANRQFWRDRLPIIQAYCDGHDITNEHGTVYPLPDFRSELGRLLVSPPAPPISKLDGSPPSQ